MHDLNWSIYFVKLEFSSGEVKYIQSSAGVFTDDLKSAKIFKTRPNAQKIADIYNRNWSDRKASVVEVRLFEVGKHE